MIQNIPISKIREPKILLRPVRRNIEFEALRDSIADLGILNSILVRPLGEETYEIVDGYYRFSAAVEAGLTEIPCRVVDMSDEDVAIAQLQANACRPQVKRCEYAERLKALYGKYKSLRRLCRIVNQSPSWIRIQLGLTNLTPDIQEAVDNGEIPVASAYMLARIDPVLWPKLKDLAKQLDAKEFEQKAREIAKEIRESKVSAVIKRYLDPLRKPTPHYRALEAVVSEIEALQSGAEYVLQNPAATPLEAWKAALQWAVKLDPESIKEFRKRQEELLQKRRIPKRGKQSRQS
jgi:ParB/RepB/Spo0J family partition protein